MIKKRKHSLSFPLLPLEIQVRMKDFLQEFISGIPEKNINETVSEFATNDRSIGDGLTANFGPFSWYLTPFNREIADCLSDSSQVLEVYVIKPTQVGFTVSVTENHIGYCIKHGIGPGLYVGGDQTMAEEQMVLRIDDMIYNSGLQHKIRENITKSRGQGKGTGDKVDRKSYGGTFFRVAGPNSENKAASFPARWLHLDEMDKYPVKLVKNGVDSGDIVMKFRRRQDSFGKLKKTLGGSTPKDQSISRIEPLVEDGDKRYYHIKCIECGEYHPLTWQNFKWEKNKDGEPDIQIKVIDGEEKIVKDPTYHECPWCGYKLRQKDKYDVLQEKGYGGTAEWRPSKKAVRPFVRSYVLNGLYGFRDWTEIMLEWLRVKDDPFLLPDFINDVLGETTKATIDKPDEHELLALSQKFEHWKRGQIKKNVIFMTIGVDVQKDRIEAGLMGWGHFKQGYMIDYWSFKGDPSNVEDQCWKQLSEKILQKYTREDGQEMYVQIAFIDSQYLSETVDMFCDSFPYDPQNVAGVFPVQARDSQDKLVKHAKSNIKTPVITIHDQQFKRSIYNILRKRPNGPDSFPSYYLHFSEQYGPEFYEQLTSEEIIPIKIRGAIKGYNILNTKQRRNEVLDVVKYNNAAFQYGMDRWFTLVNEERRLQKMPEIQESSSDFFEAMEVLLFGG